MNYIKISLLILVISCINSQAVLPKPYCHSKTIYNNLPLTINQIITNDASNYFTGYNLDIQVIQDQDQMSTIPSKLQLLSQNNQTKFIGLKNFHLEHKGNNWGSEFYSLTEDTNSTILYVGTLRNKQSVPQIYETIVVESRENVYCYDVALFLDYGLGIVDCAEKNSETYRNIFFYVDFTRKQITQKQNQIYVDYTQINRRKFTRFNDPITGYSYILRVHMADGVDDNHATNSYIQLFLANDPQDLQILRIMDRTFFSLNELSITDLKIYLGDIFMLDSYRGLYRLDITKSQHIVIMSHYEGQGFKRFSIYSDDLQQQCLIALANSHAIYQINWDNPNNPILITKYTLMAHSNILNLVINNKFVIAQTSTNSTDESDTNVTLNYTWIFSKGSRTYMNAYKIIKHQSSTCFIDINKQQNKILLIQQSGFRNYKINDAIITLQQPNTQKINLTNTIKIQATSSDFFTNDTQICTQTIVINYVQKNNMTLWKTGILNPKLYYSNYPGRLQISLNRYLIGPNITFSVIESEQKINLPTYWIYQQNQSKINIDKPPNFGQINFFFTEVVQHYGSDNVIFYYQDINNITHVAQCVHSWQQSKLQCIVVAQFAHNSRIKYFATSVFETTAGKNYYYFFNFQTSPNIVYVYDFIRHRRIATIELQEGFGGQIGSITTSNGILYLTLPFMKTINAYKLSKCGNFVCNLSFSLNAFSLKPLGINYFSPVELVSSKYHPEVLFIRCLGSVIILDVDNQMKLVLLNELFSAGIITTNYKLAINKNTLIVVSDPNIIEEYNLQSLYSTHNIIHTKNYYLYNYVIASDFDLEFSDSNSLFYVNAIDLNTNLSTILIFKTGVFLVSSLYDVINLPGSYQHTNLEIEVSGTYVDYVTIIASGKFYLYRQFLNPYLVIEDTFSDFSFYVHYQNSQTTSNLQKISVKIANYPEDFKPTEEFKKSITSLKLAKSGLYSWDTRKWFDGHILRYNYSCNQCRNQVRLNNHINYQKRLDIGAYDFADTNLGGISLWEDLIKYNVNGSVNSILLLHNQKQVKQRQNCIKISARYDDLMVVTGCQIEGGGINLYLTSLASQKGFTWGPYRSQAYSLRKLEMVNYLLVVTDVNDHPQFLYQQGAVYIYAMNLDPVSQNDMDLVQIIDSNDFYGAHDWDNQKAYLGNSHMLYDAQSDSYRLYVTEVKNGLFVIDFQHTYGSSQLNILTINYIDLNALLNQYDFHMPNDAIFLAVTHQGIRQNPLFDLQNILITTNGFHNFQITIILDDDGHIVSKILHRVYYRYAFYATSNYVKVTDGYLAIDYLIPQFFQWTYYSKQNVAVYDSIDYPHQSDKGYSQRYMIGAYMINNTAQVAFGFNKTLDEKKNAKIGLVVIDKLNNHTFELGLNKNLTLELKQNYESQVLELKPQSDFTKFAFNITITQNNDQTPKQFEFTLVLIGSFLALALLLLIAVKYCKSDDNNQNQLKTPLLVQQQDQSKNMNINRTTIQNQSVLRFSEQIKEKEKNEQQRIQEHSVQDNEQNVDNDLHIEIPQSRESIVDPPIAIERIQRQQV